MSTYYRPVQSGEGQVTVTSMDGCVADYGFYVEVKKDLGLRVPNAFRDCATTTYPFGLILLPANSVKKLNRPPKADA